MYAVSYFNSVDWASEIVGYYTTKEKAEAAIAACEVKAHFTIRKVAVDQPIDAESIYYDDDDEI